MHCESMGLRARDLKPRGMGGVFGINTDAVSLAWDEFKQAFLRLGWSLGNIY
jgi:hypothetical protein